MKMKQMRVAIRADASLQAGFGHVARSLSLGEALRDAGADVCLVARSLGVDTRSIAHAKEVLHFALPAPGASADVEDFVPHADWAGVGWQQDAIETIEVLDDWAPDWIVIDHYSFDARWHERVSAALRARIAVIDDLADRDLKASLLIDHNLHPDHGRKYQSRLAGGAVIAGGPRFALLGKAYQNPPEFKVRNEVESIGIFMGGADAGGMSATALKACREVAQFKGKVQIATTGVSPNVASLKTLAALWPGTSVVVDLPNLADVFSQHDLQIGAGGGASWERCCMGAPTLLLIVAENQAAVVPPLADLGAVATVDSQNTSDIQVIGEAVIGLIDSPSRRRELSACARSLVDGLGARRVALRMTAETTTVRPATIEDEAKMYVWRNHPSTRSASTNSASIDWASHSVWVRRVIKDPKRFLLVGLVGAIETGVIRFDCAGANTREVSLYLDPDMHGLGLGTALLLAGEAHICRQLGDDTTFVADILENNSASCKTFSSCGYTLKEGRWWKAGATALLA
jgi:UDP-2,4-diacetamido-2,4,6-trideoxy-beta-L-altropyranose hydrolase